MRLLSDFVSVVVPSTTLSPSENQRALRSIDPDMHVTVKLVPSKTTVNCKPDSTDPKSH
ncbi:hypothetical protein D3C85_1861250 [compost metagenome]